MRRVGLEAATCFGWMMIMWYVIQIIPYLHVTSSDCRVVWVSSFFFFAYKNKKVILFKAVQNEQTVKMVS